MQNETKKRPTDLNKDNELITPDCMTFIPQMGVLLNIMLRLELQR
jgi:hypothetical protein